MTSTAASTSTTTTTTTVVSAKKFDTASITKLNGENYRVWRMTIGSLFTMHKIWNLVNGTIPRPTAAGNNQDIWDQANNEAFTAMLMSMSDEEVDFVSGCKTAPEIWTKLGSMYQSISGASKQVLWQKYYSVMANEKTTPVKAMLEIQSYAAQLRAMGVALDDEAEVARIVSSLMDEKYRNFREAWRSVDLTKQTSALLLSRLKTWEIEDSVGKVSSKVETADVQQKAYSVKKPGRPKKSKEDIAELKKRTKCHSCKKTGHWKSECPEKKDKREKKEDKNEPVAYMAGGSDREYWINDSGANRHYCGRLDWFSTYSKYPQPRSASIADSSTMMTQGVGTVRVNALINNRWETIEIENVVYAPGGYNLFSENVILDKGFEVRKDRRTGLIVYYKNGRPNIQAQFRDGVQVMRFKPITNRAMACVKQATWHDRLAHINARFLKRTALTMAAYGLRDMESEEFTCEICKIAKSTKQPYTTVEKTVKYKPGQCLHADLVHAAATSHRGNKYFLIIKDQESGFRQLCTQKSKTETNQNVMEAIKFITNQTGNSVKLFRSDNGTEFKNAELMAFFSKKGIEFGLNAMAMDYGGYGRGDAEPTTKLHMGTSE